MKLLTSKKAIISFLAVSSVVLAGTIKDFHSRSAKLETTEAIEQEIIPVERSVASEAVAKIALMYLQQNEENARKINGTWEITRIVGSNEKVEFDKSANPEDAAKVSKVSFELVGDSLVRINKDSEQVYRISLFSDFGTIALVKKLGNGYEIIEAKKVVKASNTSLIVNEEVELVLERALNQAMSNKVLEGSDVSGSVSLSAKTMNGLNVELRNSNGETQSIEIDTADLMDGGTFKADVNGEEVSGVVLNNGKDGYRISFVTGPIAGSMLNFVTREQMEKIQEQELDNQALNQEVAPIEEVQIAAEKVLEERKEVANDVENYEPVRALSAEEIKETAQENGFAF